MSKKFDQAQENQLNQVHVIPRNYNLPSLYECEECGNEIPAERRAYGGIRLCVECKTLEENKANCYR